MAGFPKRRGQELLLLKASTISTRTWPGFNDPLTNLGT